MARLLRDGTVGGAEEVLQRALGGSGEPLCRRVPEILALQRRLLDGAPAGQHRDALAEQFDGLVRHALDTAMIRLDALDATSQGFAELDDRGRVIWHNGALGRMLGRPSVLGECAFDWFAGRSDLARRFLEYARGEGGLIKHRRAMLKCGDGDRRADLEISVVHGAAASVGHLFVRDVSAHLAAQERAFAAADFGVVRTGPKGEILSCNAYVAERLGGTPKDYVGRIVRDLAADAEGRELLGRQLNLRNRGEATTFVFKARVEGAAPRHVKASAFPEFESDGTTRIGTLAFVRIIEPELISRTLHAEMADVEDVRQRVELVRQHILPLIHHDGLVFSIVDETGTWSWPVHVSPQPATPWATRWFPITEAMRTWTLENRDEHGNVLIPDVREWFDNLPENEPMRQDPTVKDLIRSGITSSLNVPVVHGDRLIASISLMRGPGPRFDAVDSAFLGGLQLREIALNLAIQYGRQEAEFLNELHRVVAVALSGEGGNISAARDRARHRTVGELLTRRLCEFYSWRAVEIFEVDLAQEAFSRLAACEWVGDTVRPASLSEEAGLRPLWQGLLGDAYASGTVQHHALPPGEAALAAELPREIVFGWSNAWARSAMTLPVKLKGRVVWVINIEDDRIDAFNEQERRKLLQFVEHMQEALERLYSESLLSEIFDNASDIILVVDPNGQVCFVNDRAAMVLRQTRSALAGQSLDDLLVEADVVPRLLGPTRIRDVRCAFRRPNDNPSYVIANAASWQNAFGLKIIYATELDVQSWHADLQVIEGALAQAARLSGSSLMRLEDFLRRLREDPASCDIAQESENCEKYLANVKLTYERIRKHLPTDNDRYGWEGELNVDLARLTPEAAREVAPDRPAGTWVRFYNLETPCIVNGSRDDLSFVIRSILDYLRRRKADASRVRVRLRPDRDAVTLELAASTAADTAPTDPFEAAFAMGGEMAALGTRALRRIVEEDHAGQFAHVSRPNGGIEVFTLTLPRPPAVTAEEMPR